MFPGTTTLVAPKSNTFYKIKNRKEKKNVRFYMQLKIIANSYKLFHQIYLNNIDGCIDNLLYYAI